VHYVAFDPEAGIFRRAGTAVWERIRLMFKFEEIQHYGKEQFDTAVAHASGLQNGLSAIVSAYGEYGKKTYEDARSFVEKLSGVKSLDKALEAHSDYARTTYDTFVSDAYKIAGLYGEFARHAFKPLEGAVAKFAPTAH
jgi:hypothetical protein